MTAARETVDFATAVDDFLTYLRDVRQLSPHTVAGYARDLAGLGDALGGQGIYRPEKVQEAHIRHWVGGLHRRGLSGGTIQRALSAARSLFNYHQSDFRSS